MSTFRERLEERVREKYLVKDAPGQNGYGVEFKEAALFGARAALLLAAEDIKQSLDPYVPQARRWLQDRAAELEGK